MPVIESLELTAENLSNQSYLSVIANILQSLNEQMVSETLDTDKLTKILSQVVEAKSFYEQVKASSVNNYVSEANELLTNLHSTIESTITEIKDNYNADLTQLKETLLNSVQLSEEKTQSINNILSELQTKKEELETTFSDLESFKGDQGIQGKDGKDGIDGVDGTNGIDGQDGKDGVVTFDDLTDEQKETLKGDSLTFDDLTPEQKESLKGADGNTPVKNVDYFDGKDGKDGVNGQDGTNGKDGVNGQDGANGNDGANGLNGTDGKSNYQLAKDNGFVGTVEEYLSSLKASTDYTLLADFPISKLNGTITLSESLFNFDFIVCVMDDPDGKEIGLITTFPFTIGDKILFSRYYTRYSNWMITDGVTLTSTANTVTKISKIYGVGRK